MLRNVKSGKVNKPAIVMLHGSGSSASIFGIQTHVLAKELSKAFDLVFIDAPSPSEPGPGVLPVFAEMPGYYRWIAPGGTQISQSQRLAELFDVARCIETKLTLQKVKPTDVVAMLGFSQGGLVAMAMLGFHLAGHTPWRNLRFSVALGAGTGGRTPEMDGIENMIRILSAMLNQEDSNFPGYMVHGMGLRDLWYQDSKHLAEMGVPERFRVVEYAEGHAVPSRKADVQRLMAEILVIDELSKLNPFEADPAHQSITESLPALFTDGDVTQGLAVLAANGIEA